jgi:hypothetical protein
MIVPIGIDLEDQQPLHTVAPNDDPVLETNPEEDTYETNQDEPQSGDADDLSEVEDVGRRRREAIHPPPSPRILKRTTRGSRQTVAFHDEEYD